MEIQNLLRKATAHCDTFEKVKGYDTVTLNSIHVSPAGEINVSYDLIDDFQKNLSEKDRYKSGYFQKVKATSAEAFDSAIWEWPNRRQRELRVTVQQLAAIDGFSEQLRHAEILEILYPIHQSLEQVRGLLAAPVTYKPVEIADEIPERDTGGDSPQGK